MIDYSFIYFLRILFSQLPQLAESSGPDHLFISMEIKELLELTYIGGLALQSTPPPRGDLSSRTRQVPKRDPPHGFDPPPHEI